MAKENKKELLLKDLCSRLNTKLVCSIYRVDDQGIGYRNEILYGYCNIDAWDEFYFGEDCGISINDISKIKPYLFPLSSMTEEQSKELEEIDPEFYSLICENGDRYISVNVRGYDWLNKNHFDYRGLIEKTLALDATGLNIY